MFTPASTSVSTSVGLVNNSMTGVVAYLGLLYTRIPFCTSTTLALTPGGATCVRSVLRTSSFATSSLITMIRSTCVSFVQTVAT
ncbi:PTS system mannose-specific EIIAB component [Listeria monocytogenes]|nr:PTS system mannose-specific EIIAB component [Listeria monocytogenes]